MHAVNTYINGDTDEIALVKTQEFSRPSKKGKVTAPKTLILAGVQGCGKGTQGDKLVQRLGYAKNEMGQMLRDVADREIVFNDRPVTIGDIQAMGEFVPKEIVMGIVRERMGDASQHQLWDGMPRDLDQYAAFTEELVIAGREDDTAMLLIQVSDETARKNIQYRALVTGRPDDADPTTVDRRIHNFHAKTMPVARAHEEKGPLLVVDGETGLDLTDATDLQSQIVPLLRQQRNAPWSIVGPDATKLQRLQSMFAREVQPHIDASIEEVYQRVLEALKR